ncbi:hypothetical protein PENSPDRAFT_671904 [Peniophora sp. CONT]|nr:hypothetical protein PENSPDRAFT_671904 [Peniophora sp. CONT]
MFSASSSTYRPLKRRRRTATSVMAGDFDAKPRRDVLTSVLNGVPPNPEAENRGWEEKKRPERVVLDVVATPEVAKKKRGRPPKVRPKAPDAADATPTAAVNAANPAPVANPVISTPTPVRPLAGTPFDTSAFGSRTVIHMLSQNRARSLTPPPMPSSPPTTPGPSISSSTSQVSSKRLRTPDDLDMPSSMPQPPKERKPRQSARKGWKGWVEISDDEEDTSKRIKLDDPVPVLKEKRLRSGREL